MTAIKKYFINDLVWAIIFIAGAAEIFYLRDYLNYLPVLNDQHVIVIGESPNISNFSENYALYESIRQIVQAVIFVYPVLLFLLFFAITHKKYSISESVMKYLRIFLLSIILALFVIPFLVLRQPTILIFFIPVILVFALFYVIISAKSEWLIKNRTKHYIGSIVNVLIISIIFFVWYFLSSVFMNLFGIELTGTHLPQVGL